MAEQLAELEDGTLVRWDGRDWVPVASGGLAGSLGVRAPVSGETPELRSRGAPEWLEQTAISTGKMASSIGSEIAEQAARAGAGLSEALIGGQTGEDITQGLRGYAQTRADAQRIANARMEQQAQAAPVNTLLGEVLANSAMPMRGVMGAVMGAAEGGARGDTNFERALNIALNLGGNLIGGAGGFRMADRVRRALGDDIDKARRAAADRLSAGGMPMTRGQQTGAPGEIARDRVRSTATGSMPFEREQDLFMNQRAARAIGETSGVIDKPTLNAARKRIGAQFEKVREIPKVDPSGAVQGLEEMAQAVEQIPAQNPNNVKAAQNIIGKFIANPTGENYLNARTRLWKLADNIWRVPGEASTAEAIQAMTGRMDEAVMGSLGPELAAELGTARSEWRFLKAMRRGRSVDPRGSMNEASMSSALRSVYPGYDVGVYPEGAQGEFMQDLDDYRMAVEQFRSSGTAERLIPFLSKSGSLGKVMDRAEEFMRAGLGSPAEQVGAAAAREAGEAGQQQLQP